MNPVHAFTATLGAALVASLPLPSSAQTSAPPTATTSPASTPTAADERVVAEVRKVDREGGKVTLKHGPIKQLDMPAMTMVFRVKDPLLFEQLKEGSTVNATFEKSAGIYYVTAVEPIKP
jgi:Cu(I)/Ag(I) efflux system periplasmic protein CusF